ncbi:MAG: GNAT family N-acetyltransferase [Coriobacteriia bacterium]|nr:GNAT family N-acetyltransferase [Coriobacteriia bacterium]
MPDETIRIREAATAGGIEAARALFAEYAASLDWDLASSRLAEELADLPGPYAPPAGSLLLAYAGGLPVGVLGLQPVPEGSRVPGAGAERFAEIKRLYVRPENRRRGIARALMERAEVDARERGYAAVVLTTSTEMMPLAQGLYEDLGYEATAPYRDDLPFPGIRWLRKDLREAAGGGAAGAGPRRPVGPRDGPGACRE